MTDERNLERAFQVLREEVPVRAEWRDALEGKLRDFPPPIRTQARGWYVAPWMAIAAALLCMAAGAAMQRALQPRPGVTVAGAGAREGESVSAVGVRFSVLAPRARRVSVVGDFNGWNADATRLTLARDGQTWTTMLPLTAGRHTYAFVIDGDVVRDPAALPAPGEDFGVPNSLVFVSAVR